MEWKNLDWTDILMDGQFDYYMVNSMTPPTCMTMLMMAQK